jgi:hypothetical protein
LLFGARLRIRRQPAAFPQKALHGENRVDLMPNLVEQFRAGSAQLLRGRMLPLLPQLAPANQEFLHTLCAHGEFPNMKKLSSFLRHCIPTSEPRESTFVVGPCALRRGQKTRAERGIKRIEPPVRQARRSSEPA